MDFVSRTNDKIMTNIQTLGDPHLGRTFIEGVPLHRRGDREKMVWADFENSLNNVSSKYHVCMGDLFDKSYVPYTVILRAYRAYKNAAEKHPDTKFYILKGNHDWTRDLTNFSAFDVFAELVADIQNISVVTGLLVNEDNMMFVAWHPTNTIKDYGLVETMSQVRVAFTHSDVQDFGGENNNLIPTKELAKIGVETIYNGHIHKPETFTRDGVKVVGVGSMQPYAHGQNVNDDLYITLSLTELEETDLDLTNRCVRVILEPGEELTQDVECLQLTVKRSRDVDDVIPDVDLGNFDMELVFKKSLDDFGVNAEVRDKLLGLYNEKRVNNGI